MENLLAELIGGLVWLTANGVYLDARRKGVEGFHRFVAFWVGLPATWVTLALVDEGSRPVVLPPPDDEEALLEEVRRARRLEPAPSPEPPSPEEPTL